MIDLTVTKNFSYQNNIQSISDLSSDHNPVIIEFDLDIIPIILNKRKVTTFSVRNCNKKVWQRSRDPVSKNSHNIAQARFRSAIMDFNQTSYSNEIEQLNIYDGSLWRRTKRLKTKRFNIPQLKNLNCNLPAHTNLEKAEILANHFETQFTPNDIRDPNTENAVINSIAKFNSNSSPNKF
ncbi:hypothetical protein AVEN_123746-1 [Araneus ventricosus]|uniref:Endonuclease/exonuclease/phosphatase domain-containing protein n=1 Tax=Araneus ventricosus TaxID=182803 RepID=A0A4Y2BMS9_ARAVE|nr:hypothetical protein AVEN_123746-1 [Araneus ventricosus]